MVEPDVWGKHIWFTIHFISLGYPNNPSNAEKEKYKAFFLLLKDVLPCKQCAKHYKENLEKLPLTDLVLSNRDNLIKWTIDLHNIVNELTGKNKLEYKQARKLIDENNCLHSNYYSNLYLFVSLIIILIVFWILLNRTNIVKQNLY
jgi:hypothetical protein